MLTMKEARRVAQRGGVWLDEEQPGWRSKVSWQRLDLSRSDRCFLGQLKGDYFGAVSEIGLTARRARQLGFMIPWRRIPTKERPASWENLTRAWREVHRNGHNGHS